MKIQLAKIQNAKTSCRGKILNERGFFHILKLTGEFKFDIYKNTEYDTESISVYLDEKSQQELIQYDMQLFGLIHSKKNKDFVKADKEYTKRIFQEDSLSKNIFVSLPPDSACKFKDGDKNVIAEDKKRYKIEIKVYTPTFYSRSGSNKTEPLTTYKLKMKSIKLLEVVDDKDDEDLMLFEADSSDEEDDEPEQDL